MQNRVGDAQCTSHAATGAYYAPIILTPGDSMLPSRHDRPGTELRGELRAALAATSCNNCTTRTGAHACTETVDLCTTAVIGLERTLAHVKTP